MRPFGRSATLACFNLLDLVHEAPEVMAQATRGALDLVRDGVLSPPSPLTVMPVSKAQAAFRMMQAGKHTGKMVLSFQDDAAEVMVERGSLRSLRLNPDATYLLVGGLGGLGRSLARMMAGLGARHLAFVSRSGAAGGHDAQAVLAELQQLDGMTVKAYAADAADADALARALELCSSELPPIAGVFQLAMVLRDSLYEAMTHAQWAEALRPKVQGTWNLHEYFGHDRPLDFFVNLSSISGIIGNKGQANYAAGSTFQDAVANERRRAGLKGVSVDLGIMLDVGVIAEKGSVGDLRRWEEVIGVREPLFHALMKTVIDGQQQQQQDQGGELSIPPQIAIGLGTADVFDAAGATRPDYFADDKRFSPLTAPESDAHNAGMSAGGAVGSTSQAASLQLRLAGATTRAEAVQIIKDGLVDKIANILQTPSLEIDASRPIYLHGVDSLVAMEVRNWIRREMEAQVAIFDILEAVPMAQFAEKVADRSKLVQLT